MSYACTHLTEQGARCRNWAEPGGNWMCSQHNALVAAGKSAERVKLPDSVDYKFNINDRWAERLIAEGVEVREQDFEAKEKQHVAHAEQYGRKAYHLRENIADFGVPVFGPQGLANVSVYELFKELLDAYEIVDVYIHPMWPGKNERMRKLVVYFANGSKREPNKKAIDSLLEFLSSSCWGHVHVWANPPGFTGKIKDTVNISYREQDQTPELVLRLADGMWSSKTYVPPAAEVAE